MQPQIQCSITPCQRNDHQRLKKKKTQKKNKKLSSFSSLVCECWWEPKDTSNHSLHSLEKLLTEVIFNVLNSLWSTGAFLRHLFLHYRQMPADDCEFMMWNFVDERVQKWSWQCSPSFDSNISFDLRKCFVHVRFNENTGVQQRSFCQS